MQEFGKGRIVYFPWDLDRLVWEVLSLDHVLLLQNAIKWAANEPAPLRSSGQGFFDVTGWRQKDSITVHLVNMTNFMAMRPNIHALIPSQPQRVELDLPPGKRITRTRTLVKESDLVVQQTAIPSASPCRPCWTTKWLRWIWVRTAWRRAITCNGHRARRF